MIDLAIFARFEKSIGSATFLSIEFRGLPLVARFSLEIGRESDGDLLFHGCTGAVPTSASFTYLNRLSDVCQASCQRNLLFSPNERESVLATFPGNDLSARTESIDASAKHAVVVMRLKGKNNTKSFYSVYRVLSRLCREYLAKGSS